MALMTKLRNMIPWRRTVHSSQDLASSGFERRQPFDRISTAPFDGDWLLSINQAFGPSFSPSFGWWPGLDLNETDEEIVLRAEVPGLDPKDLEVTVREGMLQIRYEKEEKRNGRHEQGEYSERRYGAFSRTVPLPGGLDTGGAKAQCRNGILTIRIPRTQEAKQRVRRITLQS